MADQRSWRPVRSQADDEDGTASYWRAPWRAKWLVAGIAVAGGLAGLLLALLITPVYEARTTIELQALNENYLNLKELQPTTLADASDAYTETQIQILSSNSLGNRTKAQIAEQLKGKRSVTPPAVPGGAWRQALARSPRPEPLPDALGAIANSLKVRGSGLSRVIEISCSSPHPELATAYANTLVREFMEQTLETRWNSAQRTGEWLTGKLGDLKTRLQEADARLNAFRESAGLVITSGEGDALSEQKLRRIEDEIAVARSDRMNKEAKYLQAVNSPPETLPEVLDSGALREYQTKMADLRRQLAEVQSYLQPEHPKVERLQVQLAELNSSYMREREHILTRIRNEYETAKRRESMLDGAGVSLSRVAAQQASKANQYSVLKREADNTRQLYESMLQKVKEAGVTAAIPASNIRVIDPASVPSRPAKPDIRLNVVLGLCAGLFLGVMLSFARERRDRSLRGPGDASSYLHLPELGFIPSARRDPIMVNGAKSPSSLLLSVTNGRNHSVELAVWDRRYSLMAEAYRATLSSILIPRADGEARTVVFASALPQEGKTTTVSNIGLAVAETRKRVLIIDGDLRAPRLHSIFGIPNTTGLSDLLRSELSLESVPLDDLVSATKMPNLFVLPAGPKSPDAPSLLHSGRVAELLDRLRGEFDLILIDTPPVLQICDARLLARDADAVVLVCRAGQTAKEHVSMAADRFIDDGLPVVGVVLNDWDPKNDTAYGSAYYGFRRYAGSYQSDE